MTTLNKSFVIPDIYLKNNIDKHNIYYSLLKLITDKIRLIPNYELLKNETELILLVCNIIENLIKQGNKNKVDKKKLVIDVFTSVFGLSMTEIEALKITIDFLFNNRLIKRISFRKWVRNNYLIFLSKIVGM